MEHIDFVVWMLGYPLVVQAEKWWRFRRGHLEGTPGEQGAAALISMAVWAGVGWLLY